MGITLAEIIPTQRRMVEQDPKIVLVLWGAVFASLGFYNKTTID